MVNKLRQNMMTSNMLYLRALATPAHRATLQTQQFLKRENASVITKFKLERRKWNRLPHKKK